MPHSTFKHRLIGAIVVISLAVIFLPVLLDGQKKQIFEENFIDEPVHSAELAQLAQALEQQAKLRRPMSDVEMADIASVAKNEQNKPNDTLSSDKVDHSVQNTVSEEKTIDNKKNNSDHDIPLSYVVQVASFANQQNALNLVETLRQEKLDAYIGKEIILKDDQQLSRVLVGPVLTKKRAEAVVEQIKKILGPKSIPKEVEFDPLKH
ncbi:MAG: hypothetical protein COW84_10260 [Gammaproteobacteria bacterium CG22_combo_CG10-13_8_21_14_all_40_8]|nr:MAG: hypothetical protein COW84_10260 [Gammaproteobacteria bacterium CG22_combo_CG10-13_8_21_14_all_40_8]